MGGGGTGKEGSLREPSLVERGRRKRNEREGKLKGEGEGE